MQHARIRSYLDSLLPFYFFSLFSLLSLALARSILVTFFFSFVFMELS
jgi:hypothetical protein